MNPPPASARPISGLGTTGFSGFNRGLLKVAVFFVWRAMSFTQKKPAMQAFYFYVQKNNVT
jgi:hypothetical protein